MTAYSTLLTPKIKFRDVTPEQMARELVMALPGLRAALEQIEQAKKVTRKCLHCEITI